MNATLRSIALAALLAALMSATASRGESTKTIDVEIKNGAVVGKKSARVVRGDTVILRWRSDKPVELHLHGYDLTASVGPGTPAEMRIRARATGRFPVEIHGKGGSSAGHGHKAVFHLEVYPD